VVHDPGQFARDEFAGFFSGHASIFQLFNAKNCIGLDHFSETCFGFPVIKPGSGSNHRSDAADIEVMKRSHNRSKGT
jgi:hypothetical protein